MSGLSTIIGSRISTAVEVNKLLVPASSIVEHLRGYCEPALFHTDGFGEFHLSKSGSAFRAKYKGRYFLFCTAHQMKKQRFDHDQLCLLTGDETKIISSHRAIFSEGTADEKDDFDCNLYEFTEVVENGKLSKSCWYDLCGEMANRPVQKPALVCTIGFPGYRNEIDYTNFHYGVSPNAVWGKEEEPSVKGRLAFKPNPRIDFSPDGMSGGPVFGIELRDDKPKAFFAGLLTEATKEKFHFIARSRMFRLIDHALE
ncbi:hypothetical protein [uncultured Roseobacter sp.]|uniref:hypothetical protein n=1 Tax=uncultured Roseobacter sp. TaxID=114847 RepID=UPI002605756E|nr:hypothetical protein [uncultured Roseobacter sp.]